jgi:hypothetical protein
VKIPGGGAEGLLACSTQPRTAFQGWERFKPTMSKSKISRKIWLTALVVGVLVLPLGYLALRIAGDRLNENLISAKMYHETAATVSRKAVVKFDQKNHSYVNDLGDRIEARQGDEQYRVYFDFDEFNGYEEPFRSQLMEAEKKRVFEGRPRFTWTNYNDRRWYDTIQVGDKLIVTYKAFGDSEIEVLHAKKLNR